MNIRRVAVIVCILLVSAMQSASAQNTIVGINMVNPSRLTVDQQNTMLDAMQAAGVRVIRCGISPNDKGVDFAKRVYARGIHIEWIVGFGGYLPDAPTRAYQPTTFPAMWGGHPPSYVDPDQFKTYFQTMLDKLEANGITLSAFELGNEINWTAFNQDFPLPGEGKGVLSLDDLYHDPEGQQVAKGYLQYMKLLAILKDIRDHSKLNAGTPIITAGLIDAENGDIRPGSKVDAVSFSGTLDFMRANGLDKLVDGYGIHIYPNSNPKTDATKRWKASEQATFEEECQPAGSAHGKPCWVTEWGVGNKDTSCPGNEDDRAFVISQIRDVFRQYEEQGRLSGLFYFAWNGDPWEKQVDPLSVFRCNALTKSGYLAIEPLR